MEEDFISQLENKNRVKIKPILKDFNEMSGSLAYRYILYEDNNWYKLWRAVFAILQDDALKEFHLLGLKTIRILLAHLTLSSNAAGEQGQPDASSFHTELVIETLSFLSDLIAPHNGYRGPFVHSDVVEAILERICSPTAYPGGVLLAYMKLLRHFAHGHCACDRVRNHSTAVTHMIEMLDGRGNVSTLDTDEQLGVLRELLNIMFMVTLNPPKTFSELQYVHLLGVIRRLLLRFGAMKNVGEQKFLDSTISLLNHISHVNLSDLIVKCESVEAEAEAPSTTQLLIFEGWNVRVLEIILRYLQFSLNQHCRTVPWLVPSIVPDLLSILITCARCHRIMRRYIRSVVLPPLRDESKRPAEGFTLREYLCRLMTNHTDRSDAADLMFVCCKENVSRMIKYTGYDKVAEMFAICAKSAEYSSDSEDSDTGERSQAAQDINPALSWMDVPQCSYEFVCYMRSNDSV